jgi:hypothetical protein
MCARTVAVSSEPEWLRYVRFGEKQLHVETPAWMYGSLFTVNGPILCGGGTQEKKAQYQTYTPEYFSVAEAAGVAKCTKCAAILKEMFKLVEE